MAYTPVRQPEIDGESDDDLTVCDDSTSKLLKSHRWHAKSNSWVSTTVQIFLVIAATTIIILAALNLATLRSTLREQQTLNAQHSTGIRDTRPTTWSRDRRFMTLDSTYDHLWDEWTADTQIMVPGELPGENRIQASYSMFHQMHCLASMRKALQIARKGEDPGFDYWDDGHWPHCFDYLRRAILCHADDTIEVAAAVDGKRMSFIDGSRVIRQCRSPEDLFMRIRWFEKKWELEHGLDRDGSDHHHWPDSYFNITPKDDMGTR